MIVTEYSIKEVMSDHNIGKFGYGTGDVKAAPYLPKMTDMVFNVVKWLNNKDTTKKATSNSPDSYELKHIVENELGGYISNGAMIVGALMCDAPVKRISGGPNAMIGIKRSSLPDTLKI